MDSNGQLKAIIERIRQLLAYDPDTGRLVWKQRTSNRVSVGAVAGNLTSGYIEISVDNRSYRATHLVWAICYGRFPNAFIDHINGIRTDNRLCNLREATPAQNARNSRMHRDNRNGIKGVQKHPGRKKPWQARIMAHGRQRSLGYYSTPEDAHNAYVRNAQKLHGEFARFK